MKIIVVLLILHLPLALERQILQQIQHRGFTMVRVAQPTTTECLPKAMALHIVQKEIIPENNMHRCFPVQGFPHQVMFLHLQYTKVQMFRGIQFPMHHHIQFTGEQRMIARVVRKVE